MELFFGKVNSASLNSSVSSCILRRPSYSMSCSARSRICLSTPFSLMVLMRLRLRPCVSFWNNLCSSFCFCYSFCVIRSLMFGCEVIPSWTDHQWIVNTNSYPGCRLASSCSPCDCYVGSCGTPQAWGSCAWSSQRKWWVSRWPDEWNPAPWIHWWTTDNLLRAWIRWPTDIPWRFARLHPDILF